LATFLSLTFKAYVHSVMHAQRRKLQQMYVRRVVRKSRFNLNRAFGVIQGHLDSWCRQKSRTGWRRNVR